MPGAAFLAIRSGLRWQRFDAGGALGGPIPSSDGGSAWAIHPPRGEKSPKSERRQRLALLGCAVFLAVCLEIAAIGSSLEGASGSADAGVATAGETVAAQTETTPGSKAQSGQEKPSANEDASLAFNLASVPAYSGSATIEVNGNAPFFSGSDLVAESHESYSELDSLGRCGVAVACVRADLMSTEERGSIGMVKPSGWHTVRCDGLVDGNYLYNRCHLIGYQLTGENANEQNLITGTRYVNTEGMGPYETKVSDYVESTGNHVLYRSTSVFEGDNLVATGVLLETESVEDGGAGVKFCVWCCNVQPDVGIDYAIGDSWLEEGAAAQASTDEPDNTASEDRAQSAELAESTESGKTTGIESASEEKTYALNTKKFHYPSCSSVNDMAEKNKQEFAGTREEVVAQGYDPCKRCSP